MNAQPKGRCQAERGIALISALLLLLVVTIFALGMFRSFGVMEKIAGNVREKQRALQAAVSAQQYAEWWMAQGGNAASAPVACNAVLSANLGQGQICSTASKLTSAAAIVDPWPAAVTYNPGNNLTLSAAGGTNTYIRVPQFYIADLGVSADATGEVYQVDAMGFGGTTSAMVVVESTLIVKPNVIDRGGL
jgi:type IV pilus assembly protein PilX